MWRNLATVILGVLIGMLAVAGWDAVRPTMLANGPPALAWSECDPEQVEVMVLGTFHFAQTDAVDILGADRQAELGRLLDGLEEFAPDRIAVEFPYARNDELNARYASYLEAAEDAVGSRNETQQIGFRLARRLGHGEVHGVDVPMNLWHDSIQIFDDRYPRARGQLRREWDVRYPAGPTPTADTPLAELLRPWNTENHPGMQEYGLFMPLVEGDVYAGALKLRPWYDRNLRIVQNFFRILEGDDDRLLLVIGGSHVPVIRHIIDATPQLCAVESMPVITAAHSSRSVGTAATSAR
jgi:hypothetical protein